MDEQNLMEPKEQVETVVQLGESDEQELITEAEASSIEDESNETTPIEVTEENWQEVTGLDADRLCGALETLIFMSDRPIPLLKLRAHIHKDLPLRIMHECLMRLQDEYEKGHHGIRLQEVAEGYQFRTKATYSKYVHDLFKVTALSLSPTALEVLAIIAYKQPVSKNDIERIRGVDSSHIVRALMDKRLVKITGRSEEVGKPTLYGTTPEFLEVFNLSDISALPAEHELESMASKNEVGNISDIRSLINVHLQEKFEHDEIEELDKLGQSIEAISSDTLFTRSLKQEEKKRQEGVPPEGEEATPKSAFDLLEEFVLRGQIVAQNKKSAESELLTSVAIPRVANVEEEGLLNAPEVESIEALERDESEWEATKEVVESVEIEASEEGFSVYESQEESESDKTVNEERNEVDEAQQLKEALDRVFSNMVKDAPEFQGLAGGQEDQEEFHKEVEEELQSKEWRLEENTEKLIERAKNLDLDLNFLKWDQVDLDKEHNLEDKDS